ncbi:MAG: phosphoethanolamine transferase domain-containing protein, partial [Ramlibacter sp.]
MLKLFRSTGYSSILVPGETRVGMHPGWLVLGLSLWVGFVCNVGLWRVLAAGQPEQLRAALTAGVFVAAAAGTLLSLLGWRRTLKPAATVCLLLAALTACGIWLQALPFDTRLLANGMRALLPALPSLMRWQVPALLGLLALIPAWWLWSTPLRRLSGPSQLAVNAITPNASGARS